jgi:hypothetical protein
MKRQAELRRLGLRLALATTAFWAVWYMIYGLIPWAYAPDQIAIFRIWDGIFFFPWVWLIKKSYPETAFDSTSRHKKVLVWLGIFAGLSFQLFFAILAGEAGLTWWYIEIAAIAVILIFSLPPYPADDKAAPYVITGLSLGISAGCLIVGLYMAILALTATAITIWIKNCQR